MIPPRAADDFATIRARLEELRRERARAAPETGERSESGPRWRGQQERMPGGGVSGRQYPVDLPLRLDDASASPTTPPGPQQQTSSFKGKEDLRHSPPEHEATGASSMRQRSLAG